MSHINSKKKIYGLCWFFGGLINKVPIAETSHYFVHLLAPDQIYKILKIDFGAHNISPLRKKMIMKRA
jgi:hypothetical protein